MDEDQFEALVSLMETIASAAAGNATHQPRPRDNVNFAMSMARQAFGLPEKENDDG